LPVAAVLGVAVLGGLAWGAVAVGIGSAPTSAAAPGATAAAASATLTPASATATPISEQPTTPTKSGTSFTCWDGTHASSLANCGVPEGVTGLRYVFPSLGENLTSSEHTCDMVNYTKRHKYTFSYDCRLAGETTQSSSQMVRYRYWTDVKVAAAHYRAVFKGYGSSEPMYLDGEEVGTMYRSDKPMQNVGQGRYAIAFITVDGHMCLSLEGGSESLVDEMLKDARFRVPGQFRGFAGDVPAETTWNS
jgi:hypothetical protein